MTIECPREQEALEVAYAGTWPDGCDQELRAHVSSCAICRDVVRVASAILDDQRHAPPVAHIPGSGIAWWRAQMRARAEAARAASTPITVVQGIAAACIVGMGVALAGAAFPWISSWFAVADVVPALEGAASDASAIVSLSRWLPLAAVVSLLLAPVAIYFAVTD